MLEVITQDGPRYLGIHVLVPFLVGVSCVLTLVRIAPDPVARGHGLAGWAVFTSWFGWALLGQGGSGDWSVVLGSLFWGALVAFCLTVLGACRRGGFPHLVHRGRSIGNGLMVAVALVMGPASLAGFNSREIQLPLAVAGYLLWLAADRVAERAARAARSSIDGTAREKAADVLKDPRVAGLLGVGVVFALVGLMFDVSLLDWYAPILLGFLTGSVAVGECTGPGPSGAPVKTGGE